MSPNLKTPRTPTTAPARTLRNFYCSGCLRTQTFLECGETLICPLCARMLYRRPSEAEGKISHNQAA